MIPIIVDIIMILGILSAVISIHYLDKAFNFKRSFRNKIKVLTIVHQITQNPHTLNTLKYGRLSVKIFFGALIIFFIAVGIKLNYYPEQGLLNLIK